MTVIARLNHGRWIADCAKPGCRGAEIVRESEAFVCGSCYPGAFHRDPVEAARWRRIAQAAGDAHEVIWPAERGQIDQMVAGRFAENQNWEPGESIDDLAAENAAHAPVQE